MTDVDCNVNGRGRFANRPYGVCGARLARGCKLRRMDPYGMWVCGAGLSAVGLGLAGWVRYFACAWSWCWLQARWCPFGLTFMLG